MGTCAADACWGKSADGGARWMSVPQHLADSAAMAELLWARWLPEAVRRRVEADLTDPGGGRVLVSLLAGLHDVGKISPAFASDVPQLLPRMAAAGLGVSQGVRGRRHELPHGLAGAHALHAWLSEQGWRRTSANTLAAVVGGHHGTPPATLSGAPAAALLGDGPWQEARADLVRRTVEVLGADRWLPQWERQPPGEAAAVLLTAVVILADWLASDVDLFPYDTSGRSSCERAEHAWRSLRLPRPWQPELPDTADRAFWRTRFTLPVGAQPRPVQIATTDLLGAAGDPRLLLVEAPMGEGKTEAALAAAEMLAARHGCGGVLVALPTMATSDAMFARVQEWLGRLPPPGSGGSWSTYLAHGKARLNEQFQGLHEGAVQGVGDGGAGAAVAHAWLSGRKKGVLSSFVVGTIDQVLVGALRTRHLALRHLALAGKVVVLDEVHAADVYMAVYLDRVLAWLGAYGVPVVLLSATLPPARREELVVAYRHGQLGPPPRAPRRRFDPPPPAPTPLTASDGYPLLTLLDGGAVHQVQVPPSGRSTGLTLSRLADDALVAELTEALRDGGTVAVVCNTVARAQTRAWELRRVFGDDVLLVHSRFLAQDRADLEARVRRLLGPAGARPRRLVLVGTQVLEQALDIDVDLMVTDLAPVDLVLQRAGRLHRHSRPASSRPAAVRTPRLLVTGVEDWQADVAQGVRGSRAVYGEAALLRAVTVLRPFLDGRVLRLPDDIAPLVGTAYAPLDEADVPWPAELAAADAQAVAEAAHRRTAAEFFLLRSPGGERQDLLGWLDGGADEESAQGQAAVRDGLQGVEVLLLEERDGVLHLPAWQRSGGAGLPGCLPDDLARQALGCAVRLPDRCTRAALDGGTVRPPGWDRSRWLSGALVLPARQDGTGLAATLSAHYLHYDRQAGLTVTTGTH